MTGVRLASGTIALLVWCGAIRWGVLTEAKGGLMMLAAFGAGIAVGALAAWEQLSQARE